MSDDPITRLNAALEGRYRIDSELGEGGMATVYLADDLKHERKVALKVLKPELAAVVGAERFLAEIKTTANLQHPHILPLFDSGAADGFLFYVMPYVEGTTLRERLERERQLPVDEAVRIATGVAGALQHAHDRGVVHRDIKPANILLQDGQPVVADFGIALAVGAAGGNRLTETGLSVGTPYYMSPEQATGDQPVGPASDIFALACVLYEMLVGEPPYPGNTAQAVLGKIIQGIPVSATAVRGSIPANVDAAIRKALEKLPADRFTGAQSFAKALADPSFRHGEGPETLGAATIRLRRVAIGGWAAAALALTALAVGLLRPPPEPVRRVERFAVPFLEGQEPNRSAPGNFELSPDGSMLVYRRFGDDGIVLMVRRWDDVTATPVRGTIGGLRPAVSPDGLELAFQVEDQIRVLAFSGGPVRTLVSGATPEWGPDGFVYASTDSGTVRVPSTGGAVESLSRLAEGETWQWISDVLPDGRHALMEVGLADRSFEIRALDLRDGNMTLLVEGSRPTYVPSGHLVYATPNGTMMAARFDARKAELLGTPIAVMDGLSAWSLADDGKLFYSVGVTGLAGAGPSLQLAWASPTGQTTPVDPSWTFSKGANADYGMSLSPDGSMVALREFGEGRYDIWVKRLDNLTRWRLTSGDSEEKMPVWRPGTHDITFLSDRGGNFDVWSKREDGAGNAELIFDMDRNLAQIAWSPDGRWLVVRTSDDESMNDKGDIYALRPGTDSVPMPLLTGPDQEIDPVVSPDGKWIAYASDQTGEYQVYVSPFPDAGDGRTLVSLNSGRIPTWSRDGAALYFTWDGPGGDVFRAEVTTSGPGFTAGTPEVAFQGPEQWGGGSGRTDDPYILAPDGQRILIPTNAVGETGGEGAQPRTMLVNNFFEVLEQLVPR